MKTTTRLALIAFALLLLPVFASWAVGAAGTDASSSTSSYGTAEPRAAFPSAPGGPPSGSVPRQQAEINRDLQTQSGAAAAPVYPQDSGVTTVPPSSTPSNVGTPVYPQSVPQTVPPASPAYPSAPQDRGVTGQPRAAFPSAPGGPPSGSVPRQQAEINRDLNALPGAAAPVYPQDSGVTTTVPPQTAPPAAGSPVYPQAVPPASPAYPSAPQDRGVSSQPRAAFPSAPGGPPQTQSVPNVPGASQPVPSNVGAPYPQDSGVTRVPSQTPPSAAGQQGAPLDTGYRGGVIQDSGAAAGAAGSAAPQTVYSDTPGAPQEFTGQAPAGSDTGGSALVPGGTAVPGSNPPSMYPDRPSESAAAGSPSAPGNLNVRPGVSSDPAQARPDVPDTSLQGTQEIPKAPRSLPRY